MTNWLFLYYLSYDLCYVIVYIYYAERHFIEGVVGFLRSILIFCHHLPRFKRVLVTHLQGVNMAHITIMSGTTGLSNKHLRPNYGKRDSPGISSSTQNIDRTGEIDPQNSTIGGDPENLTGPKNCLKKYKTCAYFVCIGVAVTLTVILIILAATGAFDSGSS